MASLIDRVKQRMAANESGKTGLGLVPPAVREKSRKVVPTNRFDDMAYRSARSTKKMGDHIDDLLNGDQYKGGETPEFEQGPEMVEALFQLAYKPAPELENKRRLARDLYATHRIAKEIVNNPRLAELQEFTRGDVTLSTVAVDAMVPIVKEIIARIPPPPDPNAPRDPNGQPPPGGQPPPPGGGGGGGQGGGQPDPNAPQQPGQGGGQGQGQPDPNGGQQPQGGGGGGQPDPNGGNDPGGQGDGSGQDDGQNGPPPPPEEKDAEEGYGMEDEDLQHDGDEYDPEAAAEAAELDWEREFDKLLDEVGLDRMANKALDAAQREAEELENLRKSVGLDDGEWASMDPSERLAWAEQMQTDDMRELSVMLGQMKKLALGVKATKVNDVKHQPYDVELGNDIKLVLKPQFALLADPRAAYEFYRRYATKSLLQFKMRGEEEVGKGPIVICIDKSGSMNGQPFHWALGVAEALRRFAADDDRDIHVLFFGSNTDRNSFDFPSGKGPWQKIMAFLSVIANGGTQFDGVLTEALQKATAAFDAEGKPKADIVFITDGVANLSTQWIDGFNAERNRVGVRVFSVYIGGSHDFGHTSGPLGLLDSISDVTIPVAELQPEAAREIFARV